MFGFWYVVPKSLGCSPKKACLGALEKMDSAGNGEGWEHVSRSLFQPAAMPLSLTRARDCNVN